MSEPIATPYWWEDVTRVAHDDQPVAMHIDVAIVGAGYTGITAALFLARGGRSVQVFDKDRPGEGASTRNGGVTSGNIRLGADALARRYGLERAANIAAEGVQARRWLYDFIASEKLDADLRLVGRFCGAMSEKDYDRQAREAETMHRAYGIPAFAVSKGEMADCIRTDLYRGGVLREDIGGLQPARFHNALLARAIEAGAIMQGNCRVASIRSDGDGHVLQTARGECRAREVIVATDGYTDHFDRWLRQRLVPVRSRIIATEPLGRERVTSLVPRAMMLTDSRELSYYYRPSPDGTRILFGGRDGTLSGNSERPTRHLQQELVRLFPELASVAVTHSWFGNVAMHRDMMPRIFGHRGKRYGVGYCGSGVVWAPWVAYKISQQILEGDNAATGFEFRPPGLVPTVAGKAWFMPMFVVAKALKDSYLITKG